MGLGTPATVSLADAREKAASARRKIAQGQNPIDERKRTSGVPTFGELADQVLEALSAGFRNEKHKAQWKSTLETYAAPLEHDDAVRVMLETHSEEVGRMRGLSP